MNHSARAQDYLVKSNLGKTDAAFRATEDIFQTTMQGTTIASASNENMELMSMCKFIYQTYLLRRNKYNFPFSEELMR